MSFGALVVFGTRPEAIKLFPVIRALRGRPEAKVTLCNTAQHRAILDQMLYFFDLTVDHDLAVMQADQSLSDVVSRTIVRVDEVIAAVAPDVVIVQGDTATTLAGALAAYFRRVAVAHVEAGLRTYDKWSPFPEDVNRRTVGVVADFHFAPTEAAGANLRREGVPADAVHVVGNTVVDALLWTRDRVTAPGAGARYASRLGAKVGARLDGGALVTVTGHRRESFGPPFEALCEGLATLARRYPAARFVYPVHPNPSVREVTGRVLGEVSNVHLIDPLPYDEFVWLLTMSALILTDSGGVQEEAPYLGVPVLVMREHTERVEGISAGGAIMVGTDTEAIVRVASRLLNEAPTRKRGPVRTSIYGDGRAGDRIADVLVRAFAGDNQ
jgi:UDP-N-acetylglucosamine 2-epimerase (non-hydrolysing)